MLEQKQVLLEDELRQKAAEIAQLEKMHRKTQADLNNEFHEKRLSSERVRVFVKTCTLCFFIIAISLSLDNCLVGPYLQLQSALKYIRIILMVYAYAGNHSDFL